MAQSTEEAEYMVQASTAQETVSLQTFARDLNQTSTEPIVIYEDNQLSEGRKNPQCHGRAKHVDIKFNFIKEQVATRAIQLHYCQRKDVFVDVLTKGLTCAQFVKLRELLGIKTLI